MEEEALVERHLDGEGLVLTDLLPAGLVEGETDMEFEVVPEEDLDGRVEGLGQGDEDPITEEEALVERHLDGDALPLPVFVTDELLVEDVDFVCEAVAEEDTDEWPDALS